MKKIEIECFVCGRKYEKCLREYNRNEKLHRPNCCSHTCSNRLPDRKRMQPQGICRDCGLVCKKSGKSRIKTRCTKCAIELKKQKHILGFFDWDNTTIHDVKVNTNRSDYIYAIHGRIREHSRFVFKSSGKPMECSKCGYNIHVEVCHIKPVKSFDKTETLGVVNHLDNLIALCRNCHWELDHGIWTF